MKGGEVPHFNKTNRSAKTITEKRGLKKKKSYIGKGGLQ